MQSKHTPGPWTIEPLQQTEGADLAIVSPQNGWTVAIIQHDPAIQIEEFPDCESVKWHAHDLANARLIAEAPAMAAEIRNLLANARYADGQAIVLTQDCEALEAILARIDGP